MDSVASNRLEQYPQLNPYRFPMNRFGGPGRGKVIPEPAIGPAAAPAMAVSGTGTRSVVLHIGHRSNCPD
jgi:hypothetical protein